MSPSPAPPRKPTFLLIGAQKAGTTALYEALKQHPQVFMSRVKEPDYFARAEAALDRRRGPTPRYTREWESYLMLFEPATTEVALGEASPSYLYSTHAAQEIHDRLPAVKLVAILRDPVDRAYSSYLHCLRRGLEPLSSFAEALAAEPARIAAGWGPRWHYRARGLYADQLMRYRNLFPDTQIKILIYESYRQDPRSTIERLFAFLGVDPGAEVDLTTRHNVSGVARHPRLGPILAAINPYLPVVKRIVPHPARVRLRRALLRRPTLAAALAAELRRSYADENRRLSEEFSLDVDHWLDGRLAEGQA